MRDQLDRVAHSTMLGLTHPGAAELAARLVEIAPPGLDPRLLLGLRLDRDRDRAEDGLPVLAAARRPARAPHSFVYLRDAYHGDTLGAVSVGGIDLFHSVYGPLLFETHAAEPGDAAELERAARLPTPRRSRR